MEDGIRRMTKSIKILLIVGGGFAGLLVVAAIGVALLLNASTYKPRLEAAASQTLGMDVTATGRMRIKFFPRFMVTLRDVQVRNHGADVASADEIRLQVGLWPLLHKQLQVKSVELKHPALLIEQETDGGFNFAHGPATGKNLPALSLANVSMTDGSLRYLDKRSGNEVDADGCSLVMHNLRLAPGKRSDLMKDLEFTAQLGCREIRDKNFAVSDVKATAQAKHGIVTLDPASMQIFDAQGLGSVRADYSAAVPDYAVQFSLPQFQIAGFFKALTAQPIATGRMDFSVQLTFRGTSTADMTRTLAGQFSLRGKNLVLKGRDLDSEFSRFESSQSFNLVDLGALFFAGPVGLVVTKGYNFANLLRGSEGSSEIPVLVSDWNIERGMAHAQDVALTTKQHRLALNGQLDFINGKFDAVTIALIDAKGCAIVKQKITGDFQKPVAAPPNFLRTLTGPVLKLLKMGRDIFPGGKCQVFYTGSVAPPTPSIGSP
jgi:uncharacterized protein involved in outer membrane biogenesis